MIRTATRGAVACALLVLCAPASPISEVDPVVTATSGEISAAVPRSSSRSLRVATINIWGLPGLLGRDSSRFAPLVEALEHYDIVAVQEAFTMEVRDWLNTTSFAYKAFGVFDTPPVSGSGLAILSRVPIVEIDEVQYRGCMYADCYSRKGALFARLEIEPGVHVDLYTSHMQASSLNTVADAVRLQQLDTLTQFVASHERGNPVMFLGDFNIPSMRPLYTALLGHLDVEDAWTSTGDRGPGYTMTPANSWVSNSTPQQRLDYILYRDGIHRDFRIGDVAVILDNQLDGRHLSDHFGVEARLTILSKTPPEDLPRLSRR